MVDFNRKILDYSSDLSERFMNVYYLSLCRKISDTKSFDECRSLLDNKLRVGYLVYSKYLVGVDDSRVK